MLPFIVGAGMLGGLLSSPKAEAMWVGSQAENWKDHSGDPEYEKLRRSMVPNQQDTYALKANWMNPFHDHKIKETIQGFEAAGKTPDDIRKMAEQVDSPKRKGMMQLADAYENYRYENNREKLAEKYNEFVHPGFQDKRRQNIETSDQRNGKGFWGKHIERDGPAPSMTMQWITDRNAKFNEPAYEKLNRGRGSYVKLGELMNHPELYDNYPQMAEIRVTTTDNPDVHGEWRKPSSDKDPGTIYLSKQDLSNPDLTMRTLLHETQHAVSTRETWANGSSMSRAENEARRVMDQAWVDYMDNSGPDAELPWHEQSDYENPGKWQKYDAYRDIAGEILSHGVSDLYKHEKRHGEANRYVLEDTGGLLDHNGGYVDANAPLGADSGYIEQIKDRNHFITARSRREEGW